METFDGGDGGVAYAERFAVADVIESSFGETWILVIFKYVIVAVFNCLQCCCVAVNLHILFLDPIEGSDVVNAADVVAMGVCDKNGFEVLNVIG